MSDADAAPGAQTPAEWLDNAILLAEGHLSAVGATYAHQYYHGAHDTLAAVIGALKAVRLLLAAPVPPAPDVAELLADCRRELLHTRTMFHRDGHPNHDHYDGEIAPLVARIDAARRALATPAADAGAGGGE